MKIETVVTVDGENAVTITFEDGKLTGATFASGMRKLMDDMATGDFVVLLGGLAAAVDAFRRATGLTKPEQSNLELPRTIIVGDTVTEPGTYHAITQQRAKGRELGHLIHAIMSSGDDQAVDTLLDTVKGIPVPVKEESTEQPAPDAPADPH